MKYNFNYQYFLLPESYIPLHVESLWPTVLNFDLHFEKPMDSAQEWMLTDKGSESPKYDLNNNTNTSKEDSCLFIWYYTRFLRGWEEWGWPHTNFPFLLSISFNYYHHVQKHFETNKHDSSVPLNPVSCLSLCIFDAREQL